MSTLHSSSSSSIWIPGVRSSSTWLSTLQFCRSHTIGFYKILGFYRFITLSIFFYHRCIDRSTYLDFIPSWSSAGRSCYNEFASSDLSQFHRYLLHRHHYISHRCRSCCCTSFIFCYLEFVFTPGVHYIYKSIYTGRSLPLHRHGSFAYLVLPFIVHGSTSYIVFCRSFHRYLLIDAGPQSSIPSDFESAVH